MSYQLILISQVGSNRVCLDIMRTSPPTGIIQIEVDHLWNACIVSGEIILNDSSKGFEASSFHFCDQVIELFGLEFCDCAALKSWN